MAKSEEADARLAVHRVAEEWSAVDVRRLAALIALGPPSALASASGLVLAAAEPEAGSPLGVEVLVPHLDVGERVRAEVLGAWRTVSTAAGVTLGPPGRQL